MSNYLEAVDASWIKRIIRSGSSEKNSGVYFSVVVPTYNRKKLVINCLASLVGQGDLNSDFEILVIDDGSTDGTSEKVQRFIDNHRECRVTLITLVKNFGPSTARNVGILHAKGEFVAFTDDDCIVPSDWLSRFREELSHDPEISGVGGWKKPGNLEGKNPSMFDQFLYFRRLPYMRRRFKSNLPHPNNNCGDTANVCYRKNALKMIGGFDPRFRVMEDWELKTRLHKTGHTLLYIPNFVEHAVATDFRSFVRDLVALGKESSMIASLHPEANFLVPKLSNITGKIFFEAKNLRGQFPFMLSTALSALSHFLLWYGANKIKESTN